MTNMTAVRAFDRVLRPHAVEMEKVMNADAGFDGGEWSNEAHCRLWDELQDRMAAMVADRFGMTVAEFWESVCEYEYRSWPPARSERG